MGDDLRIGIFDGGKDAVGHFGAFHFHVGVHGGDDHVELRENFVVEVELAVFQDVDFDSGEQANAGDALLRGADFFDLRERALFVHAVGDGDGFRVVGERDVLVAEIAAGFAHFLDGIVAVGGGGVHLQVAANVVELDQVGQHASRRLRFRRSFRAVRVRCKRA